MYFIKVLWTNLKYNQFVKAVSLIGSGAVLAQLINLLAMPILTRIYSPSDFGILAIYLAIVTSVSPLASGKYEIAIVIENLQKNSIQILFLAFWVTFCVFLGSSLLIFFFGDLIKNLMNAESLGYWLYLVPISIMLVGLVNAINYLSNHLSEYQVIAKSKILMALVVVLSSIALGLSDLEQGLIISNILGFFSILIWLFFYYRKIFNIKNFGWNKNKKALALKYKSLLLYNAPSSLLDGLTSALPVLILTIYFSEEIVGIYALVIRLSMAPLGIISYAISQVNLKKVAYLSNNNKSVMLYLIKLTMFLCIIILPFFIIVQFSPQLFVWLFGSDWELSGTFLQILFPAIALKFLVSTLSTTLSATGHNKISAFWKVSAFVVTLSIYSHYAPNVSIEEMIGIMLITDLGLYTYYYILILYASIKPLRY